MNRRKLVVLGVGLFLLSLFSQCGPRNPAFTYREIDKAHGKTLIADLDQDGRNDVTLLGGKAESIVLFKSNQDGGFTKEVLYRDLYIRGDRAEASDVDLDGDLDLVMGINVADSLFAAWLASPLRGSNKEWQLFRIGYQGMEKEGKTAYLKDCGIADFNGDGKPDVVTRTNILTRLFIQEPNGGWADPIQLSHPNHEGMDVGDLDGDGDPDIILNGFWFETPNAPLTERFLQHTIDKKWFGQTEGSWRDDNSSVKVHDVTGDGKLDFLISHSEKPGYPISLYYANTYEDVKKDQWQEVQVAKVFDFCQTLDTGDVDNDGDVDILAAMFERDHSSEKWRNQPPYIVSVFLNEGGKGLHWREQKLSKKGMYAGVLGDVGSDGDMDIVGPRSYWTGPIDMYENIIGRR